MTEYCNDVVIYIAGFVERRMKKMMNCLTCNSAIEKEPCMYGEMVNIKTRGELLHPNVDTYKIWKTAEMELRGTNISLTKDLIS